MVVFAAGFRYGAGVGSGITTSLLELSTGGSGGGCRVGEGSSLRAISAAKSSYSS